VQKHCQKKKELPEEQVKTTKGVTIYLILVTSNFLVRGHYSPTSNLRFLQGPYVLFIHQYICEIPLH
jgi:hypothetical protein